MPGHKEKKKEDHPSPEDIPGPSNATPYLPPMETVLPMSALNEPSCSNTVLPSKFYNKERKAENTLEQNMEKSQKRPRVGRIIHPSEDVYGFDESSSDSSSYVRSGDEQDVLNGDNQEEGEEGLRSGDSQEGDDGGIGGDEDEDGAGDSDLHTDDALGFNGGDSPMTENSSNSNGGETVTYDMVMGLAYDRNNLSCGGGNSDPVTDSDDDSDDDSDSVNLGTVDFFSLAGDDVSSDQEDLDLPVFADDYPDGLPDDPFQREILGSVEDPPVSLHMSLAKGDTKTIRRWQAWQAWRTSTWSQEQPGDSKLHCAARSGDEAVVEELLSGNEVDISYENQRGHTALEVAALCGHVAVLKCLLKHCDCNELIEHALMAAKSSAVVNALMEADNTLVFGVTGGEALMRAARAGRVLLVRTLLHWGADPNWPGYCERTSLHIAATRGHVRCLTLLLENDGDVTCMDSRRWTPLHYAAYHSHMSCVRLLLDSGANPRVRSAQGQLPYDLAFEDDIQEVLDKA